MYPPSYTDKHAPTDPDEFSIEGEPAVLASVLRIDFVKDTFDRRIGTPMDPPAPVLTEAINAFAIRLRHIARAAQLQVPTLNNSIWRLEYRNDDDTPLEETPGLARAFGSMRLLSLSFVSLTSPIWTTMHELPDDYQPLPWDVLLLDAQAELPKIGTAIVLAATALEVFIAGILDQLAKQKAVPEELWSWISEREDYHQQPTLVEQYNDLLHFFTGHSLRVLAAPQGGAEQVANPSPPTTWRPADSCEVLCVLQQLVKGG